MQSLPSPDLNLPSPVPQPSLSQSVFSLWPSTILQIPSLPSVTLNFPPALIHPCLDHKPSPIPLSSLRPEPQTHLPPPDQSRLQPRQIRLIDEADNRSISTGLPPRVGTRPGMLSTAVSPVPTGIQNSVEGGVHLCLYVNKKLSFSPSAKAT